MNEELDRLRVQLRASNRKIEHLDQQLTELTNKCSSVWKLTSKQSSEVTRALECILEVLEVHKASIDFLEADTYK